MSANRSHCAAQIARLAGLPFFPGPDRAEAARELRDALARWAFSDEHATRIITEIVESFSQCPTPAQIRDIAYQTSPDQGPRRYCGRCNCGWLITIRKDGISGAERCSCQAPVVNTAAAPISGKSRASGEYFD